MERNKKKENTGLIKGAATIAFGGLVAKLIGAVYRIPLTNLIGGTGIGLYQLAYPFYCLLLTVSATGIPSSIATLTARRIEAGEETKTLFKTCMRLFLLIGGLSTLLMCAVAPFLARAQGEAGLTGGYFALAPSVFLVSAISVFRGYFQGRNQMLPTALSEIIEQAVKVGVGLCVAYLFRDDVFRCVTALLFAVTISEFAALLFLFMQFRRIPAHGKMLKNEERTTAASVLKLSIPVTLSACLIPLSGLSDSVLMVRILKGYTDQAVTLYGLFSGGAVTMINLPVSVCYGVAAASVPALSAAVKRGERGRKKLVYALLLTFVLSAVASVGLYLFSAPAAKILFRSLPKEELSILSGLVQVFAVSAITLSCTQTLAACLTALGRPSRAAVAMAAAMAVKMVLNVVLLRNQSLSIYGAAIAANGGYLVSFVLDFAFAFRATRKRKGAKS